MDVTERDGGEAGLENNALAQFLAGPAGRVTRAVAGGAIVGASLNMGRAGVVLAAVGLIPLTAGVFDFCVVSALLGGPFWGEEIRTRSES